MGRLRRERLGRGKGGCRDQVNLSGGEAMRNDPLEIGAVVPLRTAALSEINLQNGFRHSRSKG